MAIGIEVFALWMGLEPIAPVAGSSTGSLPQDWISAWIAFRVLGSVVTVPLAEELAFRDYLTRRLIATEFDTVPAGQISSALFVALHGRWLAGTLTGMLYALALYRKGEISDAVVAYATTNALIAIYVLATGTWTLWS